MNKKAIIFSVLLGLIIIIGIIAYLSINFSNFRGYSDWQKYENNSLPFTFQVPLNWVIFNDSFDELESDYNHLEFRSPEYNEEWVGMGGVVGGYFVLTDGESLKIDKSYIPSGTESTDLYPDAGINNKRKIKNIIIDGKSAAYLYYGDVDSYNHEAYQVRFLYNGNVYSITYRGHASNKFDSILKSIKFKK